VNTASLAGHSLEHALRAAASLGFGAVELLAFEGASHSQGELCGVWFRDLDAAGRERLLRLLDPFPRRSLHAPFVDAPLLTYNKRTRECALDQVRETIDFAAFIGAEAIATHANRRNSLPLEAFWGELLDVYRRLGDYALEHGNGVRLGVETGYPEAAEAFARLVREIDHPAVGATIDVGHVRNCVPKEKWGTPEGIEEHNRHLAYLLETLGDKVVHFHIHDVRRHDFRDHRGLGVALHSTGTTPGGAPGVSTVGGGGTGLGNAAADGVIDFPRLIAQVRELDYRGLWILELEEPDREGALRRSQEYLRALGVP
jgi:sugar phosphate isomerase/epimerase